MILVACFAPIAYTQDSTIILQNSKIRVVISKTNGTVISISPTNGKRKVIEACRDTYELEMAKGTIQADERADRVISTESANQMSVTLLCVNPQLALYGIKVVKTYEISYGKGYLTRDMRLSYPGKETCFIDAWTNVTLAPEFRTGGYYYVPYPHCLSQYPASKITADHPLTSNIYLFLNTAATAFVQPKDRITASSYLVANNGNFSTIGFGSTREDELPRNNPVATPTGWRHYVHRDCLSDKGVTSYRVRYSITEGDSAKFCREYLESPERLASISRRPVPDWIKDVKLMMFVTQADYFIDPTLKLWKSMSESMGTGYMMPMFDLYGHMGGDYPTTGPEPERLKAMVKKLHERVPAARIGAYNILVLWDKSNAYSKHPEWAQKDRSGQFPLVDSPGRYVPQLARDDTRNYYQDSMIGLVRDLDLDWLYVDGGDTGAFDYKDWSAHKVGHVDLRYKMLTGVQRGISKLPDSGRGSKGLFFNISGSSIADCGFQELGPGTWMEMADWEALTGCNWRSTSDALYYAKLATRYRKGTWVSHLYPYDLSRYFSMMLALSLKPNYNACTPEQAEVFNTKWVPYVNAAYEIREAQLVDCEITPNWRLQQTDWDAFTLQQGNTLLVSTVNHGAKRAACKIAVSSIPKTFHGQIYMRTYSMLDPAKRTSSQPAVIETAFSRIDKLKDTLSLEVESDPNLACISTLSTVPAWVRSVGGYKTQFGLSDAMGISIEGKTTANDIRLVVTSSVSGEVEIYCPQDWSDTSISVDGIAVNYSIEERLGQRFAIVPVSQGKHKVVVQKK